MILSMYKKALAILKQKPVKLWGVTLLCSVLTSLAAVGFGPIFAASFCVGLALEASLAMIYLARYQNGIEPKATDLFQTFCKEKFFRVVGGLAWMALWVFLWALIPVAGIVFAVIRSYEYRFTPLILMTRGDVKPTDAIKVSKELTMGYKGAMFGAEIFPVLGFWAAILLLTIFGMIPYIGGLFGLIAVLITLAFALVAPVFFGLVSTAFYVQITGEKTPASEAKRPSAPTGNPAPELIAAVPAEADEVTPKEAAEAAATPEVSSEDAATPDTATSCKPEAANNDAPVRFCPDCGAQVAQSQRFCIHCGAKL